MAAHWWDHKIQELLWTLGRYYHMTILGHTDWPNYELLKWTYGHSALAKPSECLQLAALLVSSMSSTVVKPRWWCRRSCPTAHRSLKMLLLGNTLLPNSANMDTIVSDSHNSSQPFGTLFNPHKPVWMEKVKSRTISLLSMGKVFFSIIARHLTKYLRYNVSNYINIVYCNLVELNKLTSKNPKQWHFYPDTDVRWQNNVVW